MKRKALKVVILLALITSLLLLGGCKGAQTDATAEAPPPAKVVPGFDVSVFSVEHAEEFPIATATSQTASPELVVTGSVNPDISRSVPVISLASGRVVA